MDQSPYLIAVETALRIALGLRFLHSGVGNIRRWPNPIRNAEIVFPFGHRLFGLIAVLLMVGGGSGLVLGLATRLCAVMIALFILPTFFIQRYWLGVLPAMIADVNRALPEETTKSKFQRLAKQAFHSHETGWQNNTVLLLLALFFAARGSPAFGIDNLLG